jgi:hypothetical protein
MIAFTDIEHREGQMDIGRLLIIEYANKATAVTALEE